MPLSRLLWLESDLSEYVIGLFLAIDKAFINGDLPETEYAVYTKQRNMYTHYKHDM